MAPMTPAQVDLVRGSFDALWPARRKLAEEFYRRFLALAPDARRLFPDDLERQRAKLMDALAATVGGLDNHKVLQSIIAHTGRQHAQIGVLPSHFAAFGEALMGGTTFRARFHARAAAGVARALRPGAERDDACGAAANVTETQIAKKSAAALAAIPAQSTEAMLASPQKTCATPVVPGRFTAPRRFASST